LAPTTDVARPRRKPGPFFFARARFYLPAPFFFAGGASELNKKDAIRRLFVQ
jgi:hypothetical protein